MRRTSRGLKTAATSSIPKFIENSKFQYEKSSVNPAIEVQ